MTSMARRARAAAVWALLAAPGCVQLGADYPEQRFYLLEAERKGEPGKPAAESVLKVSRFRVARPFDGREFVHREADLRWTSDFYHLFFLEPGVLLTDRAARWLAASGLFAHLVDLSSEAEPTHLLEGTVTDLYSDDRRDGVRLAVLGLEVVLLDARKEPPAIAFQMRYRREVDLPDRAADSLARGWSEALSSILANLETDLGRAVGDRRPVPDQVPATNR